MAITKLLFGFDKLDITALQESQNIDAKKFQEVFSALKEWQEAQKIDAKQFEGVFSALKEWQEAQKIDVEQFEKVFGALEDKIGTERFQALQEHLSGLQEKFTGLEEKVETFADMVGGQEQAILACAIVGAIAVIAVTSFVSFCIYQGVKLDKEEKDDLLQDMPSGKFNNMSDTKKLKNNLQQGRV
ncbi:hypothetical protein [Wolbachia endosymbiont of Trichogramma pretiosum]|uniref:hypothetical protein n=1 Tax=Wolbachia endosymbiont of Trichogramma pretiosum TaxID=125593 RepID=UPI000839A0C5|nr:hypothetical protein [Wolbachia endosymbiont of Trichogramma pretiosum]OCA06172.1 hypothetical protein wTpre_495 [Wolbachia endosymbiont of Trichogramma pretiosum]